jgi:hypothetical protein
VLADTGNADPFDTIGTLGATAFYLTATLHAGAAAIDARFRSVENTVAA